MVYRCMYVCRCISVCVHGYVNVCKCVLGERKYGLLNLKSIIGVRILLGSEKVVSGKRKEYRKLCAEKYVVEGQLKII